MNRRRFLHTMTAAATAPLLARTTGEDGFEIGLAADAQYADIPSTRKRFYRQAVDRLTEAIEHCNARELAFCVHLGDLIDRDWKSFDAMAAPLARSRHTWHQLLGNHDFDVLDAEKARVPGRLGMKWRHGAFAHGGFRFVVLDTNDVSTYAHAAGSAERAAAEQELARLQAAQTRQARPWNGGVGAAQLAWFERACAAARRAGERVIVLAHHPVFPANDHNVWNDAAVLAAIDRQPNVVAWLNGHNHAGNYGERDGVHFVTLHGMVETPETNAFATARLLRDRILITGHGREPARELRLKA